MTDNIEPNTDLPIPELQELLKKTRVNIVRMILQKSNETLALTASKLGGMGYLPIGETYPSQTDGTPLALLVQINFAQLKDAVDLTQWSQSLPNTGILQVYIGNTDLYGADFDNPYPSDTYQVRYWTDTESPVNQADLDNAVASAKAVFAKEDYALPFSIEDEFAITFRQAVQSYNINAYDHDGMIAKIIPEIGDRYIDDYIENSLKAKELDNVDPYDIIDQYQDLASIGGHQLLGYPYFTQSDPREYNESLKNHILLFQIDTDDNLDIMWGDAGVANFFITPEALLARDFSQMVYNWDCS